MGVWNLGEKEGKLTTCMCCDALKPLHHHTLFVYARDNPVVGPGFGSRLERHLLADLQVLAAAAGEADHRSLSTFAAFHLRPAHAPTQGLCWRRKPAES